MALKIMIQSNAPFVRSGYGVACQYLCKIFQKLHHEVSVFAYYGIEGSIIKWEGIDIYPRAYDTWGSDIVEAHAAMSGADIVITLVDLWVLHDYGSKRFHWYPIAPIADDPLTIGNRLSLRGAIGICAISRYGQKVLADAGIPSTHIYLPVPVDFFHPANKQRAKETFARRVFNCREDAYIIVHIGMNRGHRKGHDILLRAFRLFLAECPNAFLYMHTSPKSHDGLDLEHLVSVLGIEGKVGFPTTYKAFIGQSLSWMRGLYDAADLYVQPSLNEGQAMTVWEALSMALPVVATNATALTEAVEGCDGELVEPRHKVWLPMGCWGYEVSAEDLAEAMLRARVRYGYGYISARNRQRAVENVSLESVGHKWYDELLKIEKIVRFQPSIRPWRQKPVVIQISTRAHNCGIGAYTRALMAAMEGSTEQRFVDVLNINADNIPSGNVMHLHYESSIYPSEALIKDILWRFKLQGRPVVVTYHTVLPELINRHINEKMVDLAVIHWPLPGMVVDKRVWVLNGMGCPVFNPPMIEKKEEEREKRGFDLKDIIITTFGFAAVGRGHFEVLEQVAPLLKADRRVKMQLILPANFLNKQGADIVHSRIREIASAYGIGRQVHLITEFLPDLEVLTRLWMSDIGFLYIDFHTASSSAAIRFFISARLPVVVNGSTHFADVRRGVLTIDGFNQAEFARAVFDSAFDLSLQARLRKEHEITYEQMAWPKFAESYLAVYKRAMEGC